MAAVQTLTFGALLKRFRLAAGLTQEGLAERARLSARAVAALERGERNAPRKDTIALLADALSLSQRDRSAFELAARRTALLSRRAPALERAQPDQSAPPLVGRHAQLELIDRLLADDGPPLLMLAGEPGIGKTRLLREASMRGERWGWRVFADGCLRQGGQQPYAPIIGALDRALDRQPAGALLDQLEGCGWLVRLLPELAERALVPVPGWSLPPEQERRLMFAAVRRFLANGAGAAGTLLLLDDLQWAHADVLDLLAALVQPTSLGPLRIVGAYRSTEVRAHDPLGHLLSDLTRAGLAQRSALEPLSDAEAGVLLDALLPLDDGADDMKDTVRRRAGGVPFFLVGCARAAQAGASADMARVPWDVAEMIRQWVAVVPEPARDLLGVVAVGAAAVPLSALLYVAMQDGGTTDDVLRSLEAGCQARLLTAVGEDAYTFAHDLIREVVAADLSAPHRALLHRRVAEALEREPHLPPAELLAFHYSRSGDPEQAIRYLTRAGDRAWELHANAEAEGHYRELVQVLDGLGRQAEAARAREQLGRALAAQARYDEALAVLAEAAAIYRAEGDLDRLAQVVAQVGWVNAQRGTPAEGIEQVQPLVDELREHETCTRGLAAVLVALAHLLYVSGRYEEQLAAAERAARIAHEAGDKSVLAQAEMRRGNALLMQGRMAEGARVVEEAIPLAEEAGELWSLAHLLNNVGVVYETRGQFDRTHAYVERALAVARRLGDPTLLSFLTYRLGKNAFYRGLWRAAREAFQEAQALAQQIASSWVSAYPLLGLGQLTLAEGEREAASRLLTEAMALARHRGDRQAMQAAASALAHAELLDGDPTAARARLTPLLAGPAPAGDVAIVLPLLAWAALDAGDELEAARILEGAIAEATAEHNSFDLVEALRVRGRLAMRQRRWQEAQTALDRALALSRTMRYPYAEARVLYVYGLLRIRQGEPRQARERLEAAGAICGRLGERLYGERIRQALADLAT